MVFCVLESKSKRRGGVIVRPEYAGRFARMEITRHRYFTGSKSWAA